MNKFEVARGPSCRGRIAPALDASTDCIGEHACSMRPRKGAVWRLRVKVLATACLLVLAEAVVGAAQEIEGKEIPPWKGAERLVGPAKPGRKFVYVQSIASASHLQRKMTDVPGFAQRIKIERAAHLIVQGHIMVRRIGAAYTGPIDISARACERAVTAATFQVLFNGKVIPGKFRGSAWMDASANCYFGVRMGASRIVEPGTYDVVVQGKADRDDLVYVLESEEFVRNYKRMEYVVEELS